MGRILSIQLYRAIKRHTLVCAVMICFVLCLQGTDLFAQDFVHVKGSVTNLENIPIPNLEIRVNDSNDSTIAQTFTDGRGFYYLYLLPNPYQLQILDGDKILFSKQLQIETSKQIEHISIGYNTVYLDEVTVRAKKQVVTSIDNGFKLNVEGTKLEDRGSALSVLKYAPNVSTANGVEVLGSSQFKLIYNGKELHLTNDQKILFLKSLSSSNIRSIEIIDSPDASVGSDITSIIKIESIDMQGISATLETAAFYNDFWANRNSVDFFYGNNSMRLYGTFYNALHKVASTEIGFNGIENFSYDIDKQGRLGREEWLIQLGGDFYLDSTKTLGFFYNYLVDKDNDVVSFGRYKVDARLNPDLREIQIEDRYASKELDHTAMLDYHQKLDTSGSTLSASINYYLEGYKVPYVQNTTELTASGESSSRNERDMNKRKYLYGMQIDWNQVYSKSNLTVGGKYVFNQNTDYFDFYDQVNNQLIVNPTLSNIFRYKEHNMALYSSYQFDIGNSKLRLGSRLEYKSFNFVVKDSARIDNSFLNILPSFYYKYKAIYFNFSQSLDFGSYYDYNPVKAKSNNTQYSSGNPDLQPIRTFNFQTGYSFKDRYSLVLQYKYSETHIYNLTSNYLEGATLSMPVNGGYRNYGSLFFNIPFDLANWWEVHNSLNVNYSDFFVPKVSPLHYSGFGLSLTSSHTIELSKKIEFLMDFYYNSGNTYLYRKNRHTFSAGMDLVFKVFKNAQLDISVTDLFNTSYSGYLYDFNGIQYSKDFKYNTRGFRIDFTYRFKSKRAIDEDYKRSDIEDEMMNVKD